MTRRPGRRAHDMQNGNASLRVPDELLRPIVGYFNPVKVYVFGSRARGEARADSDYDLLVVVDDDTPRHRLTLRAGFEATESCPQAADVIPCRSSTFAARSRIVGTLCQLVDREGVVVYARA